MTETSEVRKATGLLKGQAKAIATIHKVTINHVMEVAKGNRPGREALVRTIEKYRARNAAEQGAAEQPDAA